MTGLRAWAGSYGRLLRQPVLRRVLPGMLISALGDGMSMVGVAWLALAIAPAGQTGVWIGLAVAGYALPAPLGAALLAGVMRRLTASQLIAADATLRAASLGTVAVLAAAGRLTPLVYVLLLAVSSLLHAWGSAGMYTLIAEVLPEQDRVTGNALLSTFNQAAFILGPSLAGGLTALTGPGWVIGVDAASFAVLAIASWRGAAQPTTGSTQAADSTSGGWRVIIDRPRLLGLILVTCAFFFLYGPVEVALPVHVAEGLHGSPSLLGLYWTVFGIGATIGALGAAAFRNRSPRKVVAWIIIGWGAALLPLGLTEAVVPGLIGLAAGGLIYGPFSAISTALFQAGTPPQALSPVLAVRTALTAPSTALGTLLGGPVVTVLGGQRTLLISGLLTIALGAVAFAAPQRRRDGYPALTPDTQPQ